MAGSTVDSITALLKQSTISGLIPDEKDPIKFSSAVFPDAQYTDAEETEISHFITVSSNFASPNKTPEETAEYLSHLNTQLASRTTILGSKPSIADLAVYKSIAPLVQAWTDDERTGEHGYHHIVRFVDFVQNSPIYGLQLSSADMVVIDPDNVKSKIKPVDMKAEKERKKKAKEAAAAETAGSKTEESASSGGGQAETKKSKVEQVGETVAAAVSAVVPGAKKKEKKEKAPKAKAQPPAEKPLSPCLIDLRVGHILKAERHPDADSLYVSTIACGDAQGTANTSEHEGHIVRTVCSGLNGLIPLEEMQNRKIVAVCNLKPVKMRGILSAAMVLAASPKVAEGEDSHKGPVELVNPPPEAKAGDRVFFEGWEGDPEPVLNPKKKIWETIQPGFTTTSALEVAFDVGEVPQLSGENGVNKSGVSKLKTSQGICKVSTLQGATVR